MKSLSSGRYYRVMQNSLISRISLCVGIILLGFLGWRLWQTESRLNELTGQVAALGGLSANASRTDLTGAVSRVSPSVVSVVISRNVPQLEVVYENPFGDNPLFKNFDFKVPTYRKKGSVPTKVGAGSGFVITNDGYIITNQHVVNDTRAAYTVLLSDGRQLPAKVVYKDNKSDIALLKVEASDLTPVELGDSKDLKLGQTVIAIGNALGEYSNSVSLGIIEAADPSGDNSEILRGVIQTDAAINPGNSGGPLLDLSGKVIGMNVATIVGSSNISFAIPVDVVKEVIKKGVE
jgi:serine protease Do